MDGMSDAAFFRPLDRIMDAEQAWESFCDSIERDAESGVPEAYLLSYLLEHHPNDPIIEHAFEAWKDPEP